MNKFNAIRTEVDGARECAAPGCGAPARQYKRWCSKHHNRVLRHGDPLAGRVENGGPMAWLQEHVGHADDECLIWPFGKLSNGYACAVFKGRRTTAHRVMCILAHGEPEDRRMAAHSCGKGHLGCVNPRHLRWATPSENMMDRVEHGTHTRGTRQRNVVLNEAQVLQIRRLLKTRSQQEVAGQFKVARTTIASIAQRRTWAWL